ncbi:MAG TPA: hypothetical protein VJN65_06460 [Bacteroidota bacterium]|nr:hypothetical protein [Bacteroidota bacterium]
MRARFLSFPVLVSLLLIPSQAVFSQGLSLSLLGGISRDSRTKTENFWKMGLNLGAHAFVSLPGITIGGRIAYHSWAADGEGQLKEVQQSTLVSSNITSTEGSLSVIEIVPSLRFAILNPPVGARLDLQIGAGMFLISSSTVTISGTFTTGTSTGSGTVTLTSGSLTGFGPQVALPLSLAGMIEIVPIYTAYTAGGDWYNHYALNAGFKFGI